MPADEKMVIPFHPHSLPITNHPHKPDEAQQGNRHGHD
jgi:hypothetical protein